MSAKLTVKGNDCCEIAKEKEKKKNRGKKWLNC